MTASERRGSDSKLNQSNRKEDNVTRPTEINMIFLDEPGSLERRSKKRLEQMRKQRTDMMNFAQKVPTSLSLISDFMWVADRATNH